MLIEQHGLVLVPERSFRIISQRMIAIKYPSAGLTRGRSSKNTVNKDEARQPLCRKISSAVFVENTQLVRVGPACALCLLSRLLE
jgi:hypothetical protein